MQCTPAEIERKRQEALRKLANKNKSPLKTESKTHSYESPNSKFRFTKSFPSTTGVNHYAKPYDRASSTNNPKSKIFGKDSIVTAQCVLQSESRFVVKLSAFNTQAIDVFKTIPSKNYDAKERLWSFEIKDYELVISRLNGLKGYLEITGIPLFVLNCLRSPKTDLSMIDLTPIEEKLRDSLMPFQREGVAFGIEKGGKCFIADDMGLGKTFQALSIASYYRKDWPLLIVTTASMKNTWEQVIIDFIPSLPLMQLQYVVTTRDYIDEALVLIVSHDMLSRIVNKLENKHFGAVIFDESHIFKNFKTKVTQAAARIAKKAKRVILLSGTPALSRPSELYSQLSLIDSKFFINFTEYSKRYCDAKTTHFGWDASGQSNLQELEIILAKKFMIRRTKDQVLNSMPDKSQEIIPLDVKLSLLSHEERKSLDMLAKSYCSMVGTEKHSLLLTYFSETAKIKIPSVISYVLKVLEENRKFLIFAHHQIMLDAIAQTLAKRAKKFIRIDGKTSVSQRQYLMDQFQTDDNCICAVLSITAANAGITLTAADLVIFAELHWNPSILSQAESRAHRIGQNRSVTIRYLLAAGTADDSIWPMLQKKQKILNEVGLCKDNFNDAEVKNQPISSEILTEGIENTTVHNTLDISSYFSPNAGNKKINDSVVSDLNDSFLEEYFEPSQVLNSSILKNDSKSNVSHGNKSASSVNVEDMFNDGLDDILSTIDF